MPRTARPVDLPIRLPDGEAPLRHRISEALIAQIRAGRLTPGDTLPSTRALAATLGVGRGAVVAAYDELLAAGFVDARSGSGTTVAADAAVAALAGATSHVARHDGVPDAGPWRAPAPANASPGARPTGPRGDHGPLPPDILDLRPGATDSTLVHPADWRRAWRAAAADPLADFAWLRSQHRPLQEALARHLRRSRGLVVAPEAILPVPGVNAALAAIVEAAGWRGHDVAVEDPGYVDPVMALTDRGARPRAVPVDDAGLDPGLLRPTDRAAYVTPAHQYPLGGRMPVNRRCELVEWARSAGAVVVEDDYDGEFRYDVSPLPALHSLDGAADHVLYVGTASKTLVPSLRVAWLVPPPWLREPLARQLESWGLAPNPVTTRALAELIDSGALARHLARAGRVYAARRAALVAALARHTPHLTVTGVSAGLHVVVLLPDDVDDTEVMISLERKGIGVSPLSAHGIDRAVSGLVVGYARLPETRADAVARVLAGVTG